VPTVAAGSASNSIAAFQTAAGPTNDTRPDQWHPEIQQPRFDAKRRQDLYPASSFTQAQFNEIIRADKWLPLPNQPLRQPHRPHPNLTEPSVGIINSKSQFGRSQAIRIDHTKVPNTDQTNFPLLFSTTFSEFKTVANGGYVQNVNGYDIGFYSDAALTTKLDWEIERYVPTTGEVIYHIRIPTLSHTTDTTIYVGYGDPSIVVSQANPTGVWDTSFAAVYHFNDGTTLSLADSTKNLQNGTNTNGATAGTGLVDGAVSLASASSQAVGLGTSLSLGPSSITVSALVKATSFPNGLNNIYDRSAFSHDHTFMVSSGGKLYVYAQADSDFNYQGTGTFTLTTGTWFHVAYSYGPSANLIGYVNGQVDKVVTGSSSGQEQPAATAQIGASFFGGRNWNGLIDEVRISNVVRSGDWLAAEYNNLTSPSTFAFIAAYPDRWHPEIQLPRFDLRRQQTTYPSLSFAQTQFAEIIDSGKWSPLPNQPTFNPKLTSQFLYPSLSYSRITPVVPAPSMDSWWQLPNYPRFDLKRIQSLYPSHWIVTTILNPGPDRSHEVYQPIFHPRRMQHRYPFDFFVELVGTGTGVESPVGLYDLPPEGDPDLFYMYVETFSGDHQAPTTSPTTSSPSPATGSGISLRNMSARTLIPPRFGRLFRPRILR